MEELFFIPPSPMKLHDTWLIEQCATFGGDVPSTPLFNENFFSLQIENNGYEMQG